MRQKPKKLSPAFIPMKSLLVVAVLLASSNILAQDPIKQDSLKWVSLGFNALAYKGDLGNNYSKWSGGLHATMQFNTHKKWSGSINLTVGNFTGQDTDPSFNIPTESGRQPNTYFSTPFVSFHYQLLWNVYLKKNVRIFVGQGLGLMRYNPKDADGNSLANQSISRAANESSGTIALIAPTSAGAAYTFRNRFGLAYRLTLLNAATDYLDNISQLGSVSGGDNVLTHQVSLLVPVRKAKR